MLAPLSLTSLPEDRRRSSLRQMRRLQGVWHGGGFAEWNRHRRRTHAAVGKWGSVRVSPASHVPLVTYAAPTHAGRRQRGLVVVASRADCACMPRLRTVLRLASHTSTACQIPPWCDSYEHDDNEPGDRLGSSVALDNDEPHRCALSPSPATGSRVYKFEPALSPSPPLHRLARSPPCHLRRLPTRTPSGSPLPWLPLSASR